MSGKSACRHTGRGSPIFAANRAVSTRNASSATQLGTVPSSRLHSARVEMTCFSGEKDSFSAPRKIARGSPARGCAKTPACGRLPPQAVFGPAFMPGIRGPTPRREARSRAFSLEQNTKRGRPARNDQCGQDARAPKRNRPQRRPRIWERGRLARKSRRQREAP